MKVTINNRHIDLGANPSKLMIKRWTGVYSPEPETVAWIEDLEPGVFFDIGASIGTHSVRACVYGHQVVAFEPHLASYADLSWTIKRNRLPIQAERLALFDKNVCGSIGRGRSTQTFKEEEGDNSVQAIPLDMYCLQRQLFPDYLKIDVDGNEEAIIRGGERCLRQAKSVLIEVDPVINPNIPTMMQGLGFRYDEDQVQACTITEGKYKGMANWIFWRV